VFKKDNGQQDRPPMNVNPRKKTQDGLTIEAMNEESRRERSKTKARRGYAQRTARGQKWLSRWRDLWLEKKPQVLKV
jgi:hypothetical protein